MSKKTEVGRKMQVRILSRDELNMAMPLVWDVFCKYEAVDYPQSGKQAFKNAISSDEYLDMLTAYGAFEEEKLVGIIATRSEGRHVALFFVAGEYQHKGIGRKLWERLLADNTADVITVHSSLFAKDIYQKLGFIPTAELQEDGGIRYIPMEYKSPRIEVM